MKYEDGSRAIHLETQDPLRKVELVQASLNRQNPAALNSVRCIEGENAIATIAAEADKTSIVIKTTP